ncbi:MAG: Uma2 family endonuclease [Acidobacteriota bacterium]
MGRAQSIYTIEEYLRLERASEERHEYIDGRIYAMAGESLAHSRICINLAAEMRAQLKGKPCEALSSNMKVRSGPTIKRDSTAGLFSYADLVVVCGEPRFHDEHQDVLLNPAVIFEVLSTTTEAFDRGDKFLRYRTWNETLTDYILVAQTVPLIEHFTRQPDGWLLYAVSEISGSLLISSIECRLRLIEVYDRVVFPSPDQNEMAEN